MQSFTKAVPGAAPACAALALAASASAQCDPSTIFPQSSPVVSVGDRPYSVTGADLNGDGAIDLAIVNQFTNDVSVLLNNGDGTFAPQQTYATGNNPTSVTGADLDGDGNIDLVVANTGDNVVSVLMGNGDGTFAPHQTYSVFNAGIGVVAADLDGDGTLDLALTHLGLINFVSVLPGNGDGTFGPVQTYGSTQNQTGLTAADLDGDGDIDLVTSILNSPNVNVFLNNGDGTFPAPLAVDVGGGQRGLTAADLDGDGNIDLAAVNGSNARVVLGNGDGTFGSPQTYAMGGSEGVTAADLDGDGNFDLVAANFFSDDVSVLLGNGDGTFAPEQTFAVGIQPINQPQGLTAADLDGDGDLDLAVVNRNADNVSVLLNQCLLQPLIASQPQAIAVDAGEDVTLSVGVGLGTVPLSFQWRKNGVPLVDDGRIAGSQTDTLTITNANSGDTDVYDVVILNIAGSATSEQAVLGVRGNTCIGDANGDGVVDLADLNAVLAAFGQVCP